MKSILNYIRKNEVYCSCSYYGPEGPRMLQVVVHLTSTPSISFCFWKWYLQTGVRWSYRKATKK